MSINQSKKKIKIYIFHPYSGKGGADLSLSRLINGLNDKKYDKKCKSYHIFQKRCCFKLIYIFEITNFINVIY